MALFALLHCKKARASSAIGNRRSVHVLTQCKMAAIVTLKFGERNAKLRANSVTVRNLAMVFKLDPNGIYLSCEEEGEIVIPLEENGFFDIEDFDKTYVVHGDNATSTSQTATAVGPSLLQRPSPSENTQIGLPFVPHLPTTARSALNPPPCAPPRLQRPTFTSSATSNRAAHKITAWKKSITFIEIDRLGSVCEKFQVHLSISENNATVDDIQGMLKGQLGCDVKLLDAKYLPVMPSESTTGKCFDMIYIFRFCSNDIAF